MEDAALPVVLYDFLYKDADRIASYYAQMFSGRLLNTERTTSTKETVENTIKGSFGVVGGDAKQSDETAEILREVSDARDRATNEVLAFLTQNNYVSDNIEEAPHGSLFIAKGSLLFVDGTILDFANAAFDAMLAEEKEKPADTQDQNAITTGSILKKALPKVALPSSFLLQTDAAAQVVGTVKDAGLQEPISSYYFKHGMNGLSEVYLIGIKEISSPALLVSETAFVGIAQQIAQSMSAMLFPAEAWRCTPLALFRKLI